MKKSFVLAAALALATAGTAFAQTARQAPAAAQVADHRAAQLGKDLGLAPDQQARVEQILLAERQEMTSLRAKAQAGDRTAAGTGMKEARAKYDAQLRETMSAEQFAKYQGLREEHRERRAARRKG